LGPADGAWRCQPETKRFAEVTDDDRFSGGRLAAADRAEVAGLLDHARTLAPQGRMTR
jgi:hypothetical protein